MVSPAHLGIQAHTFFSWRSFILSLLYDGRRAFCDGGSTDPMCGWCGWTFTNWGNGLALRSWYSFATFLFSVTFSLTCSTTFGLYCDLWTGNIDLVRRERSFCTDELLSHREIAFLNSRRAFHLSLPFFWHILNIHLMILTNASALPCAWWWCWLEVLCLNFQERLNCLNSHEL